jgi:flagellar biosynthesis/type III secretory pathway chaperone|tara:strand:+ start:238 stop:405 length:168 start_codon:yes stop_codon:yes gene_type:complete
MYLSIEEILSILNELEQEVKDESSHVKETKYISWNLLLIKRFKSKIIKKLKEKYE